MTERELAVHPTQNVTARNQTNHLKTSCGETNLLMMKPQGTGKKEKEKKKQQKQQKKRKMMKQMKKRILLRVKRKGVCLD